MIPNWLSFSNIQMSIPEDQVKDIFSLHGQIKSTRKLPALQSDGKECYGLLIEFNDAVTAASATITNGQTLSGRVLQVQAISLDEAVALMVKSVEQATCTKVMLENMVTYEDSLDPFLKDEIASEAKIYGKLNDVEVNVIDKDKDIVHVILHYDQANEATLIS